MTNGNAETGRADNGASRPCEPGRPVATTLACSTCGSPRHQSRLAQGGRSHEHARVLRTDAHRQQMRMADDHCLWIPPPDHSSRLRTAAPGDNSPAPRTAPPQQSRRPVARDSASTCDAPAKPSITGMKATRPARTTHTPSVSSRLNSASLGTAIAPRLFSVVISASHVNPGRTPSHAPDRCQVRRVETVSGRRVSDRIDAALICPFRPCVHRHRHRPGFGRERLGNTCSG